MFKDDRPLRGAAGLADWRLCGRLSRLVSTQRATSEQGETLLLPPGRRLRFQRVMWFGLGDAKGYTDDRFRRDLAWILGRSQALMSHHLRALREAGLVTSRREARMVFYSLTAEATAILERVVGTEVSA